MRRGVFLIGKAEGRWHTDMDALLPGPMGLLSGLLAQGELCELLDELGYVGSPQHFQE